MIAKIVITIIFATLFLVQFVKAAEDWDGITCYSGKKATPKICNSCVTLYNDYTIFKRDCYESLSQSERLACELGDAKCQRCNTTLCNLGHPKHKCKTCDSQTDISCLNDVSSLKMVQCLYDSNGLDDFYCYVKWEKNTGDNQRGCISSSHEYSDCMHNRTTCKMCIASDSDACNKFEFPENRQKCVQCDSTSGECPTQDAPESVNQYSVYCKNITDSCVVIDHGVDIFLQTCASEMTENEKEYCNSNADQCLFCTGENNCNLKQFKPTTTTTTTASTTSTPRETSTTFPSSATQRYCNSILLAIFIVVSIIMA